MLVTGKSFELMGLATFNVFLALILSVTFMSQARTTSTDKLTNANISDFMNRLTLMTAGQNQKNDLLGTAEFLKKHIDDNGRFHGTLQYDLPNVDSSQKSFDFSKDDYISHVLQDLKAMPHRDAKIRIENISISGQSREALVITTSYENGEINVINTDDRPTQLAVTGIAYCEQKLALRNSVIRITDSNCSTSIQTPDTQ